MSLPIEMVQVWLTYFKECHSLFSFVCSPFRKENDTRVVLHVRHLHVRKKACKKAWYRNFKRLKTDNHIDEMLFNHLDIPCNIHDWHCQKMACRSGLVRHAHWPILCQVANRGLKQLKLDTRQASLHCGHHSPPITCTYGVLGSPSISCCLMPLK